MFAGWNSDILMLLGVLSYSFTMPEIVSVTWLKGYKDVSEPEGLPPDLGSKYDCGDVVSPCSVALASGSFQGFVS